MHPHEGHNDIKCWLPVELLLVFYHPNEHDFPGLWVDSCPLVEQNRTNRPTITYMLLKRRKNTFPYLSGKGWLDFRRGSRESFSSSPSSPQQLPAPDRSGHSRTSIASTRPQQQAPDPSGHSRTSTARSQWALLDLNSKRRIPFENLRNL